MPIVSRERAFQLTQGFGEKRIMVLGDMMLDRYLWGNVTRISPEAPIPIVEVNSETLRLGGAANVAHNILTLGGQPIPVGVIGDDQHGKFFLDRLEKLRIPSQGIVVDLTRRTTVKTRTIAGGQHLVRTDWESREGINTEIQEKILWVIQNLIDEVDALIIEDYNKGLLVSPIIEKAIALAGARKKIITVDPKREHFFEYRGVTLFKPNRKEVEEVLGWKLSEDADVERAGAELMKGLASRSVLITLGEKGMFLLQIGKKSIQIPTNARKVHDVSGAGDSVIATFTIFLTSGATIEEAAVLANYAAGVVCGEVGIVSIKKKKLLAALTRDQI